MPTRPSTRYADGKPIKYPVAEGPSEINATPVFYKNRVYVAIGQDPEHGEGVGRMVCVDATKTGDITKTGIDLGVPRHPPQHLDRLDRSRHPGCCSSAISPGFVHCLDAETGKLYWTYDMKAHMWGSTLVADGKVYVGDEDGDFVVLAANKGRSSRRRGAPGPGERGGGPQRMQPRLADLFHAGGRQRRDLRGSEHPLVRASTIPRATAADQDSSRGR